MLIANLFLLGFFPIIFFLFKVSTGKKINTPITDITSPPIVPAAKGNQKPSFSAPIMKGINPKIVDTTVRKIGIIFEFHALVYACTSESSG